MLTIILSWISLIILMSVVWIYYKVTDNPSIVDAAWSIGHWLAGSLFLFSGNINTRTIVIWLVLTAWALRLSIYLYWTRVRVGLVDKRYKQLSAQWRMAPSLGFFLNFQFQGLLILIIVSPFYIESRGITHSLISLDYLAIGISSIAIVLETVADLQLRRFVINHPGGGL